MRFMVCFFALMALPLVASTNETAAVTNSLASVLTENHQCEAITKSGNRCKRKAAPGKTLCRQHEKLKSGQKRRSLGSSGVRRRADDEK